MYIFNKLPLTHAKYFPRKSEKRMHYLISFFPFGQLNMLIKPHMFKRAKAIMCNSKQMLLHLCNLQNDATLELSVALCCNVTIQYLSLVLPQNHFERVFIIVLNPKPNLAQIPEDEGAICLALINCYSKITVSLDPRLVFELKPLAWP